jgi:DNA-binding beta-propeller fold protein YncE
VEGGEEAQALNFPRELVVSPALGVVLVADTGNHCLDILDAETGQVLHQKGEYGNDDDDFNGLSDVAIGEDGMIFVADPGNHRIQVYDSSFQYSHSAGEFGTEEEQHLNCPRSVVVDASGRIHVVDRGNGRVQVFDAEGTWIRNYGGFEHFRSPRALAVDAEGRSFVADSIGAKIEVFDETGAHEESIPVEIEGESAHPLHLNWKPDGTLYVHVSIHRQGAA